MMILKLKITFTLILISISNKMIKIKKIFNCLLLNVENGKLHLFHFNNNVFNFASIRFAGPWRNESIKMRNKEEAFCISIY